MTDVYISFSDCAEIAEQKKKKLTDERNVDSLLLLTAPFLIFISVR
jgi:hypothetical protein